MPCLLSETALFMSIDLLGERLTLKYIFLSLSILSLSCKRNSDNVLQFQYLENGVIMENILRGQISICIKRTGPQTIVTSEDRNRVSNAYHEWARYLHSFEPLVYEYPIIDCERPHLTLTFSHEKGRSYYRADSKSIIIYSGRSQDSVHSKKELDYLALHELGHAFGLGNVYLEGEEGCQKGQKSSVMGCRDQESAGTFIYDADISGLFFRFASQHPSWVKTSDKQLHSPSYEQSYKYYGPLLHSKYSTTHACLSGAIDKFLYAFFDPDANGEEVRARLSRSKGSPVFEFLEAERPSIEFTKEKLKIAIQVSKEARNIHSFPFSRNQFGALDFCQFPSANAIAWQLRKMSSPSFAEKARDSSWHQRGQEQAKVARCSSVDLFLYLVQHASEISEGQRISFIDGYYGQCPEAVDISIFKLLTPLEIGVEPCSLREGGIKQHFICKIDSETTSLLRSSSIWAKKFDGFQEIRFLEDGIKLKIYTSSGIFEYEQFNVLSQGTRPSEFYYRAFAGPPSTNKSNLAVFVENLNEVKVITNP